MTVLLLISREGSLTISKHAQSTWDPQYTVKISVKVATLNLCLGLKNKKDLIRNYILEKKIDILCMQETEVPDDFDEEQIRIPDYNLELENSEIKRRVGVYIKSSLSYRRRPELEGKELNLVVIDLFDDRKTRIINVYRSFNPVGMTARNKFLQQLKAVKHAWSVNTVVLGDFNLDYKKKYQHDYTHHVLFQDFEEHLSEKNLIQLVNFPTWNRIVGLIHKSSILDHIYVRDPTCLSTISNKNLCFGDHDLIMFTLKTKCFEKKVELSRDWRFYSKAIL